MADQDPYAGMSYGDMAKQQFGWTGWNDDNAWNYKDVLGKARTFQEQGGATAGLRDYLQGEFNNWYEPKASTYRQTYGVDSTPDDDEGLFASEGFRNWVKTGNQDQQPQSAVQQWNQVGDPNATSQAVAAQTGAIQRLEQDAIAAQPQNTERADTLYNLMMQRATQSKAIDRNDPIVRAQSDAYAAQEERARRDYVANLAERSGPLANLRGEQRMSAERMGQRVGGFEAELLGRELTARRQEIAEALEGLQGLLSGDQVRALQRELGIIDASIRQQGLGFQQQSLQNDWQRALMQNDQFLRQLALNEWDRGNYYDVVRRGLL